MNRKILLLALFFTGVVFNLPAQGTAFFYQGHLNNSGGAANGNYNFTFSLYDAPTNGNLISGPQTNLAVAVSSGLFATNLDFGAVFTGTNYWLGIGICTNSGTNAFIQLWPRQPLLPVPYAIFANTASNLSGTLATAQLAGTLSSTQLSGTYSGVVNFTNSGNSISGVFAGDGSALVNLNGSQVASGTVADTRLSTNVAFLNGNQTFSGTNLFTSANNFTNRANNFTGSFFGNGLVGWINVSGTNVQATPDAGYLLLNSSLTTVTLPPTSSLLTNDIVRISGAGAGGWQIAQNTSQSIFGIFLNASNSTWIAADASSVGWQSIASSASGTLMVASAASSGIYTSTDGGQTWGSATATYSPVAVASSADGTKLFGVVSSGGIVYSMNSGSSWVLSGAPGSTAWTCVACSANGLMVAATIYNGKIYSSTNGGVSWFASGSTSTTWESIASSATGTRLAATVYGGQIYTSTNSGTNWTAQSGAPTASWISIASSADGSKLVAVADPGQIYTSANFGVTWQAQTNAPTTAWYHVTCSSDGGRIAAVSTNAVYISANSGVTWTLQSVPNTFTGGTWHGIAMSADGTKLSAVYAATATSGAIFYWQANSQTTSSTIGVNGSITGSQGSAVELQYIGNGQFMPVSSSGTFWAN